MTKLFVLSIVGVISEDKLTSINPKEKSEVNLIKKFALDLVKVLNASRRSAAKSLAKQ